jgi:hypothetical protein
MKIVRDIRHSAGMRMLRRERDAIRHRAGYNFHSAERVAVLYKEDGESHYKYVRDFCASLKSRFGIKTAFMMGFVDLPLRQSPTWQQHKLEADFFSRTDLNWHMKPGAAVRNFNLQQFQIIIDLTDGSCIPINYLIRSNRAAMKIGLRGGISESCYDFMIDLGETFNLNEYVKQIEHYLSNPKIK